MTPLATRPLGTARQASNGSSAGAGHGGPSTPSGRPVTGRNVPLIAIGVLLVVGCALGFSTAWLRAGGREQVLVVTTNLSSGQILTSSDLRTAQLSTSSGLSPVPASDVADVVGRPVALPLAPGSLLTDTDLGPAALPPSGQAVVGLALKAGQYPPDIAAGAAVLVVIDGSNSSGSSSSSGSQPADAPIPATVIGIDAPPADSSDSAVVSIQLAEGNGAAVASAESAGNVTLVQVSSGGNR